MPYLCYFKQMMKKTTNSGNKKKGEEIIMHPMVTRSGGRGRRVSDGDSVTSDSQNVSNVGRKERKKTRRNDAPPHDGMDMGNNQNQRQYMDDDSCSIATVEVPVNFTRRKGKRGKPRKRSKISKRKKTTASVCNPAPEIEVHQQDTSGCDDNNAHGNGTEMEEMQREITPHNFSMVRFVFEETQPQPSISDFGLAFKCIHNIDSLLTKIGGELVEERGKLKRICDEFQKKLQYTASPARSRGIKITLKVVGNDENCMVTTDL